MQEQDTRKEWGISNMFTCTATTRCKILDNIAGACGYCCPKATGPPIYGYFHHLRFHLRFNGVWLSVNIPLSTSFNFNRTSSRVHNRAPTSQPPPPQSVTDATLACVVAARWNLYASDCFESWFLQLDCRDNSAGHDPTYTTFTPQRPKAVGFRT